MHANKFKLDEKYKMQVQNGANSITQSIKEANQKKREAKFDQKTKKKLLNLADFIREEAHCDDDNEAKEAMSTSKKKEAKLEMIKPRFSDRAQGVQ